MKYTIANYDSHDHTFYVEIVNSEEVCEIYGDIVIPVENVTDDEIRNLANETLVYPIAYSDFSTASIQRF